MDRPLRIAMVAGEASGDQIGAALITALKSTLPNCECYGIAGPNMVAAGCHAVIFANELEIMGLTEVIKSIPRVLAMRRKFVKQLLADKPDIFIGIDAPDFNLSIEETLKAEGVFTVHYNSPKVWAWRQYRVKKIQRAVDLMLTQFPFEADFYQPYQVPAVYVGHPFADQIPVTMPEKSTSATTIGLALGSRHSEIKYHSELFIRTAQWLQAQQSNLQFIVPMVNQKRADYFKLYLNQLAPKLKLDIVLGDFRQAVQRCDVMLTAAGTATLEIMLLKKPMVVTYRLSRLTYALGKCLVKVAHVALPNLLANKRCVPELIQGAATPETLGHALLDWINHPARATELKETFTQIHKTLKCDAGAVATQALLQQFQGRHNEKNNCRGG